METVHYKNNKPVIGYLCSYFPESILTEAGFDTLRLFEINAESMAVGGELPINICSYVRYCQRILNDLTLDGIVLTNCCNGMQRLYDYIREKRPDLYCCILELPRQQSQRDYLFYKMQADTFIEDICKHFKRNIPEISWMCSNGSRSEEVQEVLQRSTVYVIGSAVSQDMREKIDSSLEGFHVQWSTCAKKERGGGSVDDFLRNPCARMDTFAAWFADFLSRNSTNLSGIIYISSQHCDSFLFQYPSVKRICEEKGVPLLGLEESYRNNGFGQMLTRIEAFLESMSFNKEINNRSFETTHIQKEYLQNPFRQRMSLVKAVTKKLPLRSIQMTVENQIELFTQRMWEAPQRVIWTNMVMPAEIFYAAGLIPVNMELVAGWTATLGLSRQYISKCEGMGFSSNLCSYHKATVGMIEDGALPKPVCVSVSSHICDGGPSVAALFSERYGAESYILNIPFMEGRINSEYLNQQYKELIAWVEGYTGKQIKGDALAEALALSNKAREYWGKAFELRKGRPLFPGHLSLRNLFGSTFLFGSELGLEVARSYYEELMNLSRLEEEPGQPGKKRILWIHFAPLYNNKIMEYLENELNCWIVMDITGYIYWPEHNPEKPIESLAKRSLSHFYLGEPAERRKLYNRLIGEYEIDGVIHFMHNGCRAIPGSAGQVREICEENKVAYLELAGDCIDPRGFSEEQMRLRLEAFKETLEARKRLDFRAPKGTGGL